MVKSDHIVPVKERILSAARKVFLTRGMAGARMQDIADEAGINKALLHYYFRDKERLFELIFMEESRRFFPRINKVFQSDKPLFEKIAQFVEEYISQMLQNPFLPIFVLNELNRDPDRFLNKIWGKKNIPNPTEFLLQIEKEVKKGTIRKVDPSHLLMNLLSMTIFPFVARPMLQRNLSFDEKQFREAMEERKKEIPRFIIDSIRKK